MAIHLDINTKQFKEHVELHYLPAEIETDSEANVDEFFNIYTSNDSVLLTNSLRGYPLDGIGFVLPLNLKGVVLQDTQHTLDEGLCRLFRVTGSFKNLTYWNYDKVPSAADALRQALKVLVVLGELSTPICAEDIKNETENRLKTDL